MKRGPEKTDLSKLGGFSFGIKASGSGTGAPRAAAAQRSGAVRPPSGNVKALFQASLDDDDDNPNKRSAKKGLPSWAKPTAEGLQAKRQADELLAQDPTVFQYDEVIDEVKQDMELESLSQAVRADSATQKKRTGLFAPKGSEMVAAGNIRQSKYIDKVLLATDRRKAEQQIVEDKLLQKEKNARKDCEVFVTEAFKEELKRRSNFEEELEKQEMRDQMLAAEKQENGKGFADMYRNLLNGGLATSRGGEKLREKAAPRADLEEPKEEPEEKVKEEAKKEETKEEDEEGGSGLGVQDAVAPEPATKKAKREAEEAEKRDEKVLGARERYLLRKKQEAEAAAAAANG